MVDATKEGIIIVNVDIKSAVYVDTNSKFFFFIVTTNSKLYK